MSVTRGSTRYVFFPREALVLVIEGPLNREVLSRSLDYGECVLAMN